MERSAPSPIRQIDDANAITLPDSGFKYVPPEVFSAFRDIRRIDLRRNNIATIPKDIAVLECLVEVLFDNNMLTTIPAEIFSLPAMEKLSVSHNLIEQLPPIGPCSNLRMLNLAHNRIEKCPEILPDACKKLSCIQIHHNEFTSLHTSFSTLDSLNDLSLEWFRYTTPPLSRQLRQPSHQKILRDLRILCAREQKGAHIYDVMSNFSERKFDVAAKDLNGRTRLHIACTEGHVGVALGLLDIRADCNVVDGDKKTPLLYAISNENERLVKKLCPYADLNFKDEKYRLVTPLQFACTYPNVNIVKTLLDDPSNIPINQADDSGNTPLHIIATLFDRSYPAVVPVGDLLVARKANPNELNQNGYSPLQVAASGGQYLAVKWMCLKNQQVTIHGEDGEVHEVSEPFDLDLRGGLPKFKRTALQMAVLNQRGNVVQSLLEFAADPFVRDANGCTAKDHTKGNVVMQKMLRKFEHLWIWYRTFKDVQQGAAFPRGLESPPRQPNLRAAQSPSPSPGVEAGAHSDDEDISSGTHERSPSPYKPRRAQPWVSEHEGIVRAPIEHDLDSASPSRPRLNVHLSPVKPTDPSGVHPMDLKNWASPERHGAKQEDENPLAIVPTMGEIVEDVKEKSRNAGFYSWDMPQVYDLFCFETILT